MTRPDPLLDLLGAPAPFDEIDIAQLRGRRGYKWSAYPEDVLPAFVAEMDFAPHSGITASLMQAVAAGDTGYAREDLVPASFAAFSAQQWSWTIDPARVVLVPDVMSGVARGVELLTAPGDGVITTPPVYPSFRRTIERLGRRHIEAPMRCEEARWRLDLDAIAAGLAAGARAVVLCNPHNPTGSLPSRAELAQLIELAAKAGAAIISDEVHGPLTLPGRQFTPLLSLGAVRGVTVTSPSKAWNVMGLKCALVVAGDEQTATDLAALPSELRHPGQLGVLAALAAYDGGVAGDGWLQRLGLHLQRQHERAHALLTELIPGIRPARADAGYLLWLDCRELGLGDAPAQTFLERGRVALSPGLDFGTGGAGYARLNIATSGELLLDAVSRMRTAVNAS